EVNRVGLAKRCIGPVAIHARARRIIKPRARVKPGRGLKPVDGSQDVHLGVERGVVNAWAYSGPGGQVDDHFGTVLLDKARDLPGVANVQLDQAATGISQGEGEVRLLGGPGVERVEVVHHGHFGPFAEQPVDQVRSDETGSARHNRSHSLGSFHVGAGSRSRHPEATYPGRWAMSSEATEVSWPMPDPHFKAGHGGVGREAWGV